MRDNYGLNAPNSEFYGTINFGGNSLEAKLVTVATSPDSRITPEDRLWAAEKLMAEFPSRQREASAAYGYVLQDSRTTVAQLKSFCGMPRFTRETWVAAYKRIIYHPNAWSVDRVEAIGKLIKIDPQYGGGLTQELYEILWAISRSESEDVMSRLAACEEIIEIRQESDDVLASRVWRAITQDGRNFDPALLPLAKRLWENLGPEYLQTGVGAITDYWREEQVPRGLFNRRRQVRWTDPF